MTTTPTFTVPTVTSYTNLKPLTTSFSFPSNCLSNLYDFSTFGLGAPWTYETQGCALSTCCPSNNYYTVGWGWFTSYYSPGVCPSDYHSCAPYTGLSKAAGETIIFCCLDGYSCPTVKPGDVYYACASLLSTTTIVTVLNDIFSQCALSTRTFSNEAGQFASYQIAYPLQIRHRNMDRNHSSRLADIDSTSPGLSEAAKIGLGAGLGAGLSLAILILIIYFVFRSRRRRTGRSQPYSVVEPVRSLNPEGDNPPPIANKPELDGQALGELDAGDKSTLSRARGRDDGGAFGTQRAEMI